MKLQLLPLASRLIMAGCLSLIAVSAYSQSPCKYVKETKDQWTDKTVKIAQMAIGNGMAGREVILQQSEGKYYIGLRITFNTDFPDVDFKKGDKVTFKLANGQLIEYAALKDLKPTIIRMLNVPIRNWYVDQEVDKSVYEQLAASPIVAIKFHINGNDQILPEIKARQTRKIQETAECMLQNP